MIKDPKTNLMSTNLVLLMHNNGTKKNNKAKPNASWAYLKEQFGFIPRLSWSIQHADID